MIGNISRPVFLYYGAIDLSSQIEFSFGFARVDINHLHSVDVVVSATDAVTAKWIFLNLVPGPVIKIL
jgi:hypothetical protein